MEYCINVNALNDENPQDLKIMVASGPYMMNGSILFSTLINLVDVAKAKQVHLLILMGPFIDANHDLISTGNLPNTYDELFQKLLDDLANELKNSTMQVVIQPSLNDLTQEPIYPVHPFNVTNQFLKQSELIHFVPEPCMIRVNDILMAITSTDIVKDLTMTAITKSSSTDKIARNFSHMLRQRSFYPLYPPPDHVCIDYEAWYKYARIEAPPRLFFASSDLTTFNKVVNNCNCINPGRLVKGTSTGTYAQLILSKNAPSKTEPEVNVSMNASMNTSKLDDDLLGQYALTKTESVKPTQTQQDQQQQQQQQNQSIQSNVNEKELYVTVTFHKI